MHSNNLPISNDVQDQARDEQFRKDLAPFCERWKRRHEQDLELRYETGKLLNGRLGTPEKRQARNKGVLKQVSEQLKVAVSELSRMRSFAHSFSSLKEFKDEYPEAKTWTAVKKLLPAAKAQAEPTEPQTGGTQQPAKQRRRRSPKHDVLKRSLEELSSRLQKVHQDLEEPKKEELRQAFRAFVKSAPSWLKVRVSVGDGAEKTSPSVAPNPEAA